MSRPILILAALMLLISGSDQPDNPWKAKVPKDVPQTAAGLKDALEAAYRADDWQAGLRFAQAAMKAHADEPKLRGMIVRALSRAGHLEEAETRAKEIPRDTRDPVALRELIAMEAAQGHLDAAGRLADRLESVRPQTAEDLMAVSSVRFAANRLHGLADLVRRIEKLLDPNHGYPETFFDEAVDGVADFLAAVGVQPLNQIAEPGAAAMPPLVLLNLPSCDVLINGRGPYRMVVDTGGSVIVALDQAVADELGLKSVAKSTLRGASGKTDCGQVLLDELRIGTIRCRRVICRTFDVRAAVLNAADGVLGTGIFMQGRMTLDLAGGQLHVARSSDSPGPGQAVDMRLVSDAKLILPVKLDNRPALALLDTGADVVATAPSVLKDLFPDREIPTFNPGVAVGIGSGENMEISFSSGATLRLGGREFKNYGGLGLDVLDKTLGPALGVRIDMLLGMPMFREMKSCTVDYARCKMWIDWAENSDEAPAR
jgi:hypothetical protein